jgi:acyl-CoA reductase-like NAD-dependent aldehyde dehydrogenase
MENQASIKQLIQNARVAMEEVKDYSQAEIDKIVKAMGKASYYNAEMLATLAVEEGGFGNYDSKVFKNRKSPMAAWYSPQEIRNLWAVIEEDKTKGYYHLRQTGRRYSLCGFPPQSFRHPDGQTA